MTVLFWFIASLALTAVTPGAVSRAVARLQLTNLRVGLIGLVGSIVLVLSCTVSLWALPTVLGALVGMMALLFITVAYLFGRVVVHAATGRWLQRVLLPEGKRSESIALLAGTCFWTIILSLPFVWPLLNADGALSHRLETRRECLSTRTNPQQKILSQKQFL